MLERLLDRARDRQDQRPAARGGVGQPVVEGALDGAPLFADQPARERALDVFSQLRIWDTAHNNGVLIYLLLADRDVEIVADRGLAAKVPQTVFAEMAVAMGEAFRRGDFEAGLIRAVDEVGRLLLTHFAVEAGRANPNELPDAPVFR